MSALVKVAVVLALCVVVSARRTTRVSPVPPSDPSLDLCGPGFKYVGGNCQRLGPARLIVDIGCARDYERSSDGLCQPKLKIVAKKFGMFTTSPTVDPCDPKRKSRRRRNKQRPRPCIPKTNPFRYPYWK